MTFVTRREGETIDALLRRFDNAVKASNVWPDFKRHVSFQPPAERRRFKQARSAARRAAGERRYQQWLAKQR